MKSAIPWIIAALACAVAASSWLRPLWSDAPQVETTDPAVLATPPMPPPPSHTVSPLAATTQCLARLGAAQSSLERCRGPLPARAGKASGCLSDPEVAEVVEQRIEEAIADHLERDRDRRAVARAKERSAFDEWATDALQMSAEEGEWLTDYVCAARELRERTLASLDETPSAEALEELKRQRGEILEDMKKALGDERYAKLREIGGIGLVADATNCS